MAQDLTASQMQIILMEMDGIFKNKATLNPQLTNTPVVAPAILERQTADVKGFFAGFYIGLQGLKEFERLGI